MAHLKQKEWLKLPLEYKSDKQKGRGVKSLSLIGEALEDYVHPKNYGKGITPLHTLLPEMMFWLSDKVVKPLLHGRIPTVYEETKKIGRPKADHNLASSIEAGVLYVLAARSKLYGKYLKDKSPAKTVAMLFLGKADKKHVTQMDLNTVNKWMKSCEPSLKESYKDVEPKAKADLIKTVMECEAKRYELVGFSARSIRSRAKKRKAS